MGIKEAQNNQEPLPASEGSSDQKWFSEEHQGKAKFVAGSIHMVRPRKEEQYYLRMILHHMKGAASYKDLRNVNGEECASSRDICRRRGLLIDSMEWKNTLQEGFHSNFAPLTELFAIILAHFFSLYP